MDCSAVGLVRHVQWSVCCRVKPCVTIASVVQNDVVKMNVRPPHIPRIKCPCHVSKSKHAVNLKSWRTNSIQIGTDDIVMDDKTVVEHPDEDVLSPPLSRDQLKALLTDPERSKLVKKLSEANQQNRFLKRQLQVREADLVNLKSELAALELELEALVAIADEVRQLGTPQGSRKINGRYIQSHLVSRLKALEGKLKEQIKGVEAAQSKEVNLFWVGMAESVQVMGSFDGWSQGEHMSPEYTGLYTKFSTTLLLRPGRYEIKFLVDGEWQISSEFPTVGEGVTENNLLIVE